MCQLLCLVHDELKCKSSTISREGACQPTPCIATQQQYEQRYQSKVIYFYHASNDRQRTQLSHFQARIESLDLVIKCELKNSAKASHCARTTALTA